MHAVTYQQHSLPHEEDLNYLVPWSLCSYCHVAVTPLSTTTSHQNNLVQLSKLTNTFPENKIHCLTTDKNLLPVFLLSHLSSISLWNMQLWLIFFGLSSFLLMRPENINPKHDVLTTNKYLSKYSLPTFKKPPALAKLSATFLKYST